MPDHATIDEIRAAGGLAAFMAGSKNGSAKRRNKYSSGELTEAERRFYEHSIARKLAGEILAVLYIGDGRVKFPLAAHCTYNPDFLLVMAGGVEFCEVKGAYEHDDGWRIKFKVARERYPGFRWSAWRVTREGIEEIRL